MTSPACHEISLDLIDVGDDRARDLDPSWAEALSVLIAAQGLMHPVIVRPIEGAFRRYRLVAGLHRLEGMRLLGAPTIPAYLSSATTDDEARLQEVMENLGRAELIALDRCHHLFELKKAWLTIHPEARAGGDHGNQFTGGKTQTLRFATDVEIFGFGRAMAERVGLSVRTIETGVKIWSGLSPEARRRLPGTALAAKQTELKALSEETPARQGKILDLILSDDHPSIENVAAALAFLEGGTAQTALEKRYRVLSEGLKALSPEAFDRLLIENEDRVLDALKRLGRI